MKVRIVSLFVLSLILFSTNAMAETVAGLPLHIQKFESGAIRVWIGDHISSTATVAFATRDGLVIIDTLGNPEIDRELRRIIAREFGREDFKYLINTHEHGDHTGGNVVYEDCTIVGHELVEEGMNRGAASQQRVIDWLTNRIAEQEAELDELTADDPGAARLKEDLILNRIELKVAQSGNRSVPPTKTFSDHMVLDLGDTTFELYYIGGMHTSSDIAVFVPEHGLVMTGDTMADVWLTDTPGCLASFMARPGVRHDFPLWIENWTTLLAKKDAIKTFVPGHWNGELTLAGCQARVNYIRTLWEETNRTDVIEAGVVAMLTGYTLASKFPELVESPGFNERNNYQTIVEIWTEVTGQRSAAQALYQLIDEGNDEADVRAIIAQYGTDSPGHYFLENEINAHGYRFIQQAKVEQAIVMFRVNVELYPESWNVYDSLGEALLESGDRDTGIAMYEKSIELNPESTNGIAVLERIRNDTTVN